MKKFFLVLMVVLAFGVAICGCCSKPSDASRDQPVADSGDPNDPGPNIDDFPARADDVPVVEPIDEPVAPTTPATSPELPAPEPAEPVVDETTDFDALGEAVENEIDSLINQ